MWTPKIEKWQLPDLAHVYLVYSDRCKLLEDQFEPRIKNDKAFKATMRIYPQTCESNYNISMNTSVVSQTTDLEWSVVLGDCKNYNSWDECTNHCAASIDDDDDDDDEEKVCISKFAMQASGVHLGITLNASALIGMPESSIFYNSAWSSALVKDVMGPSPMECSAEPGLGIDGFKRMINNVAIGMTNA